MTSRLGSAIGLFRSLVIYHGQPWRVRALRKFMRGLVGPGALAFDIGAHAGNRSLALAKAGARVVALEPQPVFLRLLQKLAAGRDIVVRGDAVGRSAGAARLRISARHPTLSSVAPGWPGLIGASAGFEKVAWDTEIDVPMVTLDGLIATYGRPDFIKVDVEGSEAEVLAGLSQPVPLIAFEYLPAAMEVAEHCLVRLSELGRYEYNLVIGERQRFERPAWLPLAGFRDVLLAAAETGASGDVYARLVPTAAGGEPANGPAGQGPWAPGHGRGGRP